MKRYTYNQLKSDVEALNSKLAEKNHEMRFKVGGRNGYTAIDLATVEEMKRGYSTRMLEGGSPRECLAACYQYMVQNLV